MVGKSGSFLLIAFVTAVVGAYFSSTGSEAAVSPPPIDFQTRTVSPAGKPVIDNETGLAAVMPMTFQFVRTPDRAGPDGKGRYVIAVNSGYGLTFTSKSKPNQTLSVIDLNRRPEPMVVQTVYFAAPQSANFGLVFDPRPTPDGKYNLYLAGGFENKIWILGFDPAAERPLAPANSPDSEFKSLSIDVAAFAQNAPSPNYNSNVAAVYPTGIDLAPDVNSLFVANNLGDSLGIVEDLRGERRIRRVGLARPGSRQFVYPYDVKAKQASGRVSKIYVSLWGDGSVAVVDGTTMRVRKHITVERHPTAMLFNRDRSRLYVANSDGDSVSVIDTIRDEALRREPKIDVRLANSGPGGVGPQGLALSENERTLYVANSKANAVAVVTLGTKGRSRVSGFIPTGNYASAVAVVGESLLIANGKGTGMSNSSNVPNESGLYPNMPNTAYPGDRYNKRGAYSAAVVSGNVSVVAVPDEKQLFTYTQQVMRDNGLLGTRKARLFPTGRSPFKHVIYVIRENRTYDQVFGDLPAAGDGTKADGDPSVAIFGAGEAARSPNGEAQNVTPNARALALRFGLLDRFFVNSEASPDGHNWSTAAFSSDYVDKAFRWNYSGRGRTYDYEGFNRLPAFEAPGGQPPVALPSVFNLPATADDVVSFQKRYVPYYQGARDVAEPETLYLWDAAARAGLTYRNYGEFVGTVSEADLREVNTRKRKQYPDLTPTLAAFPTKRSLEGHFSPTFRNYDLATPDSMTVESYRAAVASVDVDPAIRPAVGPFPGSSRFGEWQREFREFAMEFEVTGVDKLPNLSIVRFSNDHTAGMSRTMPTPQFFVAENDYALGRLVQEVSNSPYWKDTAIFVVEDDAQDGPDHVDAHRSPAFVISAWNRKGALVHEFHSTVSLIRTLELCLGIKPMNFLDANAIPIDIFGDEPDLSPFTAILPSIAANNLMPPSNPSRAAREMMRLTAEQNLTRADMADPRMLNEIIWFSVRGQTVPMPALARLPAYDALTAGVADEEEDGEDDPAE
jgi:YVTN family beta-propeller protein